MSNKEQRKAPILRFKGYTDDWELHKWKNILLVNSGKDYKHLNKGSIPVYGTGGYMLSVDKELSNKDAIGIGRKGTIDHPQYLKAPFWTVDTLFFMTPKKGININFAFALSQTINWKKYDESTGLPSLSKNSINNISVKIPKYNEQKKIGNLISQIERLLALQQRKLNDLDKIQKMLEDSLFPNTKNIRKLKFTQDNWQVRKLKDIFNERNIHNQDEQLLSVSISKGIYPFNSSDRKDNSSSNKSNYKLVEKGDIAYNSMRMWQGACGVSDYKGIVSPAYTVITPHREENARFYFYYFKNNRMKFEFRRHSQGLTSDTWNLKFPLFKNISIETPNNENEQIKISQILNTLNKTMNYNRNRINKLNLFKKFLLQKMFI